MAFTTTYSFEHVADLDLDHATSGRDLTGLAGGGIVGVGDDAGHTDATVFGAGLDHVAGVSPLAGANAAVDQLANGDLVIATESAGDIVFRITTATGASVLGDTPLQFGYNSRPDVAALADGGFVVTSQAWWSATDSDIDILAFDAGGAVTQAFRVAESVDNDQDAVVAGLADGGYAVAWTRITGTNSADAWYAVYNAD